MMVFQGNFCACAPGAVMRFLSCPSRFPPLMCKSIDNRRIADIQVAKSIKNLPFYGVQFCGLSASACNRRRLFVCYAAKGQRPRKPRTWKTTIRKGTISKSQNLVKLVKTLSNVKEEIYGALDSFIAWQVQFPVVTIKKAVRILEEEREWKRIIQMCKWMLEKGQGKTFATYYTLLNALLEEERMEEAEELWNRILFRYQEHLPRSFFALMIRTYHKYNMVDKLFEAFADMEELGIIPGASTISIVSSAFKTLGMVDKNERLLKKYSEIENQYSRKRWKKPSVLPVTSKSSRNHPAELRADNPVRVKDKSIACEISVQSVANALEISDESTADVCEMLLQSTADAPEMSVPSAVYDPEVAVQSLEDVSSTTSVENTVDDSEIPVQRTTDAMKVSIESPADVVEISVESPAEAFEISVPNTGNI